MILFQFYIVIFAFLHLSSYLFLAFAALVAYFLVISCVVLMQLNYIFHFFSLQHNIHVVYACVCVHCMCYSLCSTYSTPAFVFPLPLNFGLMQRVFCFFPILRCHIFGICSACMRITLVSTHFKNVNSVVSFFRWRNNLLFASMLAFFRSAIMLFCYFISRTGR